MMVLVERFISDTYAILPTARDTPQVANYIYSDAFVEP